MQVADGRPRHHESHGFLLGPLVALHSELASPRYARSPNAGPTTRSGSRGRTPPDYRDRHLDLAVRRSVLRSGDRVLFVDEWAVTGGRRSPADNLGHVEDAGARWTGAAVVVDALESLADRRALGLRGLLHVRDLNRR